MAMESATINIRYPYFAPMLVEDTAESPPDYDNPFMISEATQLTRTPTVINVPAYGNGVIVEEAGGSTGGTVALGVHALPLKNYQKLYGGVFDANGAYISTADDTPPYGALLFESQKNNGKTRWTVLYKVKFQPAEKTINQKTETVTFQQPTINATYSSRQDFVLLDGKRVYPIFAEYDEESENFNRTVADNWYKEVYEVMGGLIVPASGVTLDQTTVSINVGDITQLTATVAPADATNKVVTWGSDDTGVATVSAAGLITGIAAGTATITVTTVDGGKTDDCAVIVS